MLVPFERSTVKLPLMIPAIASGSVGAPGFVDALVGLRVGFLDCFLDCFLDG